MILTSESPRAISSTGGGARGSRKGNMCKLPGKKYTKREFTAIVEQFSCENRTDCCRFELWPCLC